MFTKHKQFTENKIIRMHNHARIRKLKHYIKDTKAEEFYSLLGHMAASEKL